MTTKILKAIEEFESARAKATQGEWMARQTTDSEKCHYVFIDAGYFYFPRFVDNEVTRRLKKKPNFENDTKLICEAANNATKLTQALKVAVEALEKSNAHHEYMLNHFLSLKIDWKNTKYASENLKSSFIIDDAFTEIERILNE